MENIGDNFFSFRSMFVPFGFLRYPTTYFPRSYDKFTHLATMATFVETNKIKDTLRVWDLIIELLDLEKRLV